MKYVPPLGQPDDAPFVDGNPATGTRGSIVPAAALEHPQREIIEVILAAGLTPNGAVLTQLRDAINSLILAATGGGETSDYLTMTVARARLLAFPEILTADGRMNVISPGSGSVQIPTGVQFVHRGVFQLSTSDFLEAQRTFATSASKVYHLRWRPAPANFVLLDLADAGYNPGALAESDPSFDSTFDDMLIARVVTNSSNVATITTLRNLDRAQMLFERTTALSFGAAVTLHADNYVTDFARRPLVTLRGFSEGVSASNLDGGETAIYPENITRYGFTVRCFTLNSANANYFAPPYSVIAALGGRWL